VKLAVRLICCGFIGYTLQRCWPSECIAMTDLDARTETVLIERSLFDLSPTPRASRIRCVLRPSWPAP
jgi:hypothetical protein